MRRVVGIDIGAETIKLVEARDAGDGLHVLRRQAVEHGKEPAAKLVELLRAWDWDGVAAAAVTGRLGRIAALPRLPVAQAMRQGYRLLVGDAPATVVSIGSRGFSVLELHDGRPPVHRENSRCAQGTGNFLRQLVDRFGLSVEEAARLADGVPDPAPLSGRCPVILKTDMTHLANRGEPPDRILAGLLDAIAENVESLVKPRGSPPRVLLTGGVARSRRVREHFRTFLERSGMALVDADLEETLFLEAAGCAAHAAAHGGHPPPLDQLLHGAPEGRLELLPALAESLPRVRRLRAAPVTPLAGETRRLLLGFDIGSTGAKVVALDAASGEPRWETWRRTSGDPVGAAQALMRQFLEGPEGHQPVTGFGATGSGREIVGSMLSTCYGADRVFVLNEIAAHARGALQHDPRVDTIFEIGGQDAKYVRLDAGRVVDAAMNEACSAGTGSFIEEQGRRFEGLSSVEALGEVARKADGAIALGQHCSIFMAEVIDEAVAAGAPRDRIVAGLYDSIISNYLNRVKGSRPVGRVVFCQGMPFAADALAAAVARQTGAEVIVPPSPGTVGALGIALLASESLPWETAEPVDGRRLLEARLEKRDGFVCGATSGCGGSGNKCRIDRLTTLVAGERRRFTWGGSCSLYDQGTRRARLPDRAPDPFREREEWIAALAARLDGRRGGRTIAVTDELTLKGLFPFFATFLHGLGLDLELHRGADRAALKRGIEGANVPFCAPMQQHHGLVSAMAAGGADLVFAPMLRELPRVAGERASQICPIVQGAPDVLRHDLGAAVARRLVSPVIDVGPEGLGGELFERSCAALARSLGFAGAGDLFQRALQDGRTAQADFEAHLLALGRRALERCERDGIVPVVVLGRTYTIHNDVLNSNLPAILREQGAIAIPADCLPIDAGAPIFPNMFWGYGQRILRAAWQIRRMPGVYALFASNYSCGPDSFTLPFASRLMEGRPFAVVETDGHAGDAGTRTRVEAFLHCVREDLKAPPAGAEPADAARITVTSRTFGEVRAAGETLLVPRMGSGAEVLAAAARGVGVPAEALAEPTSETLRAGRRHTSGKECLPMAVTLGSLLERVARPGSEREKFTFFMPSADGPCRFGAYKELHQIVLERLGLADRVRIWSPPFSNYFQGVPPGFGALVLSGLVATDLLRDLHGDVKPVETHPGASDDLLAQANAELVALVEREVRGELRLRRVLVETATGRLWGIPALLRRTAQRFAKLRGARDLPRVMITGEIYVRNDPFCTGDLVSALHRRGLRARVVPMTEFLYYSFFLGGGKKGVAHALEGWVRRRVLDACHGAIAAPMGWPGPVRVADAVKAGSRYFRDSLRGEAILTLGTSLHAWRHGEIDAVISAGPLECMPNKLAEAQFHHAAANDGLLSLTLNLNGEPPDPELLDGFAFEVHARHRARAPAAPSPREKGTSWIATPEPSSSGGPTAT